MKYPKVVLWHVAECVYASVGKSTIDTYVSLLFAQQVPYTSVDLFGVSHLYWLGAGKLTRAIHADQQCPHGMLVIHKHHCDCDQWWNGVHNQYIVQVYSPRVAIKWYVLLIYDIKSMMFTTGTHDVYPIKHILSNLLFYFAEPQLAET